MARRAMQTGTRQRKIESILLLLFLYDILKMIEE
jgi:hypothetical protein